MSRRVFILGSTGSIGCSAVKVIEHLRSIDGEESWPVIGLAAGKNASLLQEQALILGAEAVSLATPSDIQCQHCYTSAEELLEKHAKQGDLVLVAIVGFAGILPTLKAIECGCDVALANKEALVAGGKLVMDAVAEAKVSLIPVDSEHSAIFQALSYAPLNEVAQITLTASGGSLRNFPEDELHNVSVEQVLNHPTWSMGAKVTVDSASLMNKALELIEAHWLFGVDETKIQALIHPQSIVHGMVEFNDGSVIAQMSPPDMKLPIQYAFTWPKRSAACSKRFDWSATHALQFEPICEQKYPAIRLAFEVIRRGGTAGAVFNAANEVVVEAFLQHSLPFGSMVGIVEQVLENISIQDLVDFETVVAADQEARQQTLSFIASQKVNS
jgi:1-deoxy-D-xylulose-5-phosphate reductoisomerase